MTHTKEAQAADLVGGIGDTVPTEARKPPPKENEAALDESRALQVLALAVEALTAAPGHPAADQLVLDLLTLARACHRRAQALRLAVQRGVGGHGASLCVLRADLLAERATAVAAWARRVALGGDPAVLDNWLAHRALGGESPLPRAAA